MVGGHLRGLDDYVQRRLQLAGGSLLSEESLEHNRLDLLKTMYLQPLDTLKAEFERAGRNLVSFANYDYAGLINDPRIKQAACDAIMTVGIGAGASRLVGGERAIHSELERDLAAFLAADDAIALVSGYMTNVSLVGYLLTKNDMILVDELSHNSIIVGTDVSRARVIRFAHNDLDHLDSTLKQVRNEANRVLIIVEGLYSMDGDIANLPRLLEIRDRYEAWLMVDEAHSLGVLGPTGRGLAEHFGIDPKQIDLIVGTMSKTLAACGGFIAGRKSTIDWLRFTLPAFVFSVGLSPALAAAAREGLGILRAEPWRVARLQNNSRQFLEEAKNHGFDAGPAMYGGSFRSCSTIPTSACLRPEACSMRVTSPCRFCNWRSRRTSLAFRFFISVMHTDAQISGVVEVLARAIDNMRPWRSRRRWLRRASIGSLRGEAQIV
jgi:8-amino-7-oxononanoate synthase